MGLRVAITPLFVSLFFEQTTYNGWRKQHDSLGSTLTLTQCDRTLAPFEKSWLRPRNQNTGKPLHTRWYFTQPSYRALHWVSNSYATLSRGIPSVIIRQIFSLARLDQLRASENI